jgi:hypothetical protein
MEVVVAWFQLLLWYFLPGGTAKGLSQDWIWSQMQNRRVANLATDFSLQCVLLSVSDLCQQEERDGCNVFCFCLLQFVANSMDQSPWEAFWPCGLVVRYQHTELHGITSQEIVTWILATPNLIQADCSSVFQKTSSFYDTWRFIAVFTSVVCYVFQYTLPCSIDKRVI